MHASKQQKSPVMIKRVATGVGGSINVMGPGDGFWTVGPILKAVESKLFFKKILPIQQPDHNPYPVAD